MDIILRADHIEAQQAAQLISKRSLDRLRATIDCVVSGHDVTTLDKILSYRKEYPRIVVVDVTDDPATRTYLQTRVDFIAKHEYTYALKQAVELANIRAVTQPAGMFDLSLLLDAMKIYHEMDAKGLFAD